MKTDTDELSMTFAALADPTRRAILARLRTGEATLGELAGPFDMSLRAVALHMKVLERSGLITRVRVVSSATPDSAGRLGHHLTARSRPGRPARTPRMGRPYWSAG